MLKSPWVTLVAVPLGFALLAIVAAARLGQWTAASTLFAALGGLMLVGGGLSGSIWGDASGN